MNWLNRAVVCCDCNRPTLDTIEGAGFRVTALEHTELPKAPSFVRPAIVGTRAPTRHGSKPPVRHRPDRSTPDADTRGKEHRHAQALQAERLARSRTSASPRTATTISTATPSTSSRSVKTTTSHRCSGACPAGTCPCPHWGYVFKGRLTIRYGDHEETVEAGEAFYMPPGHAPAAEAGTEFVQFSPTDQLAVSEAVMAKNMQEMQGGR